jgi:hypothetical protein
MLRLTYAGQNRAAARRLVCLQASFVVCKRLRTVERDAGSKDAIRSNDAVRMTFVFHKLAHAAGLENSDGSIILSGSQGLG